ncbi:E3 ubiquitin-protein ligase RGLG2-like isoform X2 [Salvia miltiorrhiza]|uniref:E3 ubiquitin-protein ligase RGLG2-like isoform X2 n=1 Tax=Salvia miltiorrhiza TaxID=226208 RepID=UPI0025ABCAEE|nr:E3 ubiquitin-protein ligase RGLG2-like isoform X2 [Salvia miltiorrhiza]XP_057791678.1 E3 ubiquitin-protein ligase RGLG2-like isoform X2 [Salvia miltiorrhiza]XP_057791679.1 E3 ubiquitin-protein ligase RGLG2-like isoform X2 [Salvia miltiorrhiza]XP_057791680.1 E3 ubiquitin-protein ligase RGLG2-like isoform X2 [Salvia miltiorrhiza]XP_057791681.1 E3 ubiquitin-protein ligase RGLG2-like isoform X2 [Salvia miltiorrhiza]XP_057791682.1 E3 ubiquitin-protein ligase RGLG2-like isoform X2 [Salvia miltior
MGNKNSSPRDEGSWRQPSTTRTSSSSGWTHDSAHATFSQYAQNYPKPNQPSTTGSSSSAGLQHDDMNIESSNSYHHDQRPPVAPLYPAGYPPIEQFYATPQYYAPPSPTPEPYHLLDPTVHVPKKRLDKRYSRIADNYHSLQEVTEALARAGLESSNLIIGIDFTKSNEWTGKKSYNGQSLHHIGSGLNPYEQAITIVGKTLAAFDDDNLIPCFGFGDASTHDQDVFSFYPDGRHCNGFEEVLHRYRELVPNLKLAGPTSFAPIIEMAMTVVEQNRGQYHVLVIIADGQVTRSVDTEYGQLSPQEQKTVQAIVEASKLPLSIVLVGVGDGPWDTMKEFDDNIPAREFDNFQFVNFTEIMAKNTHQTRKETEFALSALMEIPTQYKATMELNLLGGRKGHIPERIALPPPIYGAAAFGSSSKPSPADTFQYNPSSYYEYTARAATAPSAPSSNYEHQICPICLSNPKDMAFGCGHQTCCECGQELQLCPICRNRIETRIKLY